MCVTVPRVVAYSKYTPPIVMGVTWAIAALWHE